MQSISHRGVEEWMGAPVETLEDLLRPELRAVCVGINPAPVSVSAGHYYQGTLGQRFYKRLRSVSILPPTQAWDDDLAFEVGIGFTDVVKRPSARAADVTAREFAYGKARLLEKIESIRPGLVIFTFKKAAETLLGQVAGNGIIDGRDVAGVPVFVMPGPYAPGQVVEARLRELARLI